MQKCKCERQRSRGDRKPDSLLGCIKGRGVRPARPRMTGPVIPTSVDAEFGEVLADVVDDLFKLTV